MIQSGRTRAIQPKEPMDRVIIHYHELALKGKNRPFFVRQLVKNLSSAAQGTGVRRILRLSGRVALEIASDSEWKTLRERLSQVFGVANFSLARRVPLEIEALKQAAVELIQGIPFESFRIQARRGDKSLPFTSVQVNQEVGAYVKGKSGARVDLKNAEVTIYIEMLPKVAFCYLEKCPGLGGLPVGVSGRVVSLLSGGIDSPVAADRMMRRGTRSIFVHFHSHPFLNRASQEKAQELAQLLTRHQYRSKLYLIPFGELQREVVLNCPPPLRVVLYRRMMMRIAEGIARGLRAQTLVTGESLGQVASQTLENMAVIQEAVRIPVHRPLIGMDKEEIIRQAKEIGSYETSIIPDQDCCQLFVPKHPAVRSTLEQVQKAEERLDIVELIQSARQRTVTLEYKYP